MRTLLIIAMLFICSCSWTKTEVASEIAWQAIHTIDWRQTRGATKGDYIERGPAKLFLGERPSTGAVDTYFITGAALHLIVSDILPSGYNLWGFRVHPRLTFQGISIAGSAACVINNFNVGVGGDW